MQGPRSAGEADTAIWGLLGQAPLVTCHITCHIRYWTEDCTLGMPLSSTRYNSNAPMACGEAAGTYASRYSTGWLGETVSCFTAPIQGEGINGCGARVDL
jgi:hypothetical protein